MSTYFEIGWHYRRLQTRDDQAIPGGLFPRVYSLMRFRIYCGLIWLGTVANPRPAKYRVRNSQRMIPARNRVIQEHSQVSLP